ncbi:unnamed protein product [Candida verbasci]|uniref:RNA polymerase II-associated protein 3 n=1 Tax=Candida verbasci TaxID=1227364 RepID=A0A9W4XEI4_9ASCO|nr:unnamed protein product [Candida verbasci]
MPVTSESLKVEGNKAFSEKQYKKAAKLYGDAIQLDIYNPVLYSNRAQCFLNLKDYTRAYQDCISGLNLGGNLQISIKLNYRKGLALIGLNRFKDAKAAFENVLELDPNNELAKSELKKLSDLDEDIDDGEVDEEIDIPIEKVDELPKEYADLLKTSEKVEEEDDEEEEKVPELEPSEEANKEINELFGSKSNSEPKTTNIPKIEEKVEISPMHYLTTLKKLPDDKKAKGYKYVLTLTRDDYANVFGSAGIDTEFLEFFLHAILYCCKNTNFLSNWSQLALSHLDQFSKFKRFDLSMMMCDDNVKKQILQHINDNDDKRTYTKYFS